MGKASRRKKTDGGRVKVAPAPYVARPFAGLPGETDWVAAHEIVPAATATLTAPPAESRETSGMDRTVNAYAPVEPLARPNAKPAANAAAPAKPAFGSVFTGSMSELLARTGSPVCIVFAADRYSNPDLESITHENPRPAR